MWAPVPKTFFLDLSHFMQPGGFEYGRSGNPTREAYEGNVAACEGAKYGLAFGSGLGATVTYFYNFFAINFNILKGFATC